uniref:Uncharacterized protein n=1 Tax=uncultured marine virus TaxID=186617 RepID=A0A0F7L3N4_9VIRU|nr:hypothetical protein [uncultured marine virus]
MTVNTAFDYAELYLATQYVAGDTTLDCYAKSDTYKLTDQKTSSLITSFRCVGIDRDDASEYMGMAVSNVVENGTFQGATRYTVTLRTSDGSNPMVGLANTDDGTDADANIVSGNALAKLPANSLIMVAVGTATMTELLAAFEDNVENRFFQVFCFDSATDVSIGDGRAYFQVPAKWNGDIISVANATVLTAGATGSTTIQLYNVTQSVDVLSTPITISDTDTTGSGVVNAANDDVTTGDILRVDIDTVTTTEPKGLIVNFELEN